MPGDSEWLWAACGLGKKGALGKGGWNIDVPM